MSTPRRSVKPAPISRTLYVFTLATSILFGLMNLVVAIWGAGRGESLGYVLGALVRVAPFVALGLLARWLYVGNLGFRPNKPGQPS